MFGPWPLSNALQSGYRRDTLFRVTVMKISARVLASNSADDFVNPPELGVVEQHMPRVKNGRFIVLPITDQTRGHGTHSLPAIWKGYLAEFLKGLPQR